MNVIWDLFRTFAKIGMFTFGGGYAMISIIEDMCVARRKWISHDEMMNITVIAEDVYKRQGLFWPGNGGGPGDRL